jgi:hypothetical protein
MFDWPDAIQTSPTRMSSSAMAFTVRMKGPPGSGGRQVDAPAAERVRGGDPGGAAEGDGDGLGGVGLAPDVDRESTLHDHVPGDQVGKGDGSRRRVGEREGQDYRAHGAILTRCPIFPIPDPRGAARMST